MYNVNCEYCDRDNYCKTKKKKFGLFMQKCIEAVIQEDCCEDAKRYTDSRPPPPTFGKRRRDKYKNQEQPVCPHCDYIPDIDKYCLYFIFEEGTHDITCPNCDEVFEAVSSIEYKFSTQAVRNE